MQLPADLPCIYVIQKDLSSVLCGGCARCSGRDAAVAGWLSTICVRSLQSLFLGKQCFRGCGVAVGAERPLSCREYCGLVHGCLIQGRKYAAVMYFVM